MAIRSMPVLGGAGNRIRSMPVDEESAAGTLTSMANMPEENAQGRYINPYEEYSNPTQYPGFEQLPQKEKLERIAFSQFDPANQTPLGGFVPPGAYEQPATRAGHEALLYGMLPVAPFESSIANALTRTGSGTALGTGLEMTKPDRQDTLVDALTKHLAANTAMEGLTTPLRLTGKFAELVNPENFAQKEIGNIRKEYTGALDRQDKAYNHPELIKYDETPVTANAEKYVSDIGIKRQKLLSESKDLYDTFMAKPTFGNLHRLQSQINKDAIAISRETKPYTKDAMKKWGRELKNSAYSFLKEDKAATNQYRLGDRITRKEVKPFERTEKLRNILAGNIENASPRELSGYINTAIEKGVPAGHYLKSSLSDIENRMNRGNLIRNIVPEKIRGYMPNIVGQAQNPYLAEMIRNYLSPAYYGAGRGLMGYNIEK